MKVSRLASEIGMQSSTLYRELVHRGLQIKSMEHPLDAASVEANRDQIKQGGRAVSILILLLEKFEMSLKEMLSRRAGIAMKEGTV